MLMCDFGHLADEVTRLEDAGTQAFHLDVMDGHFVPNLTYGLTIVEAVRKCTELPIDAHLMIGNPAEYVERYVDAGADSVTIHIEAIDDPTSVLMNIRSRGAAAGLALNPPTPIESIYPYLPFCDVVLVMSVMPGFGGQVFDASALGKLTSLKERLRDIETDNGRSDCADDHALDHARARIHFQCCKWTAGSTNKRSGGARRLGPTCSWLAPRFLAMTTTRDAFKP